MLIEDVIKYISKELDVPLAIVEEVTKSEFKFILDHCKNRDGRAINCIHLGKFLKNKKYDESGRYISRMEKFSV